MAFAWVERVNRAGGPAFFIRTDRQAPYYELFVTVRPELMRPEFAHLRGQRFWSSRQTDGGLRYAGNGVDLYPLPQALLERLGSGDLYYMVKTYHDRDGNAAAISPVMSGNGGRPVMSGVDPTEEGMASYDLEERMADLSHARSRPGTATLRRSRASRGSDPLPRTASARGTEPLRYGAHAIGAETRTSAIGKSLSRVRRRAEPELAGALALVCARMREVARRDPMVPGKPSEKTFARVLSHTLAVTKAPEGSGSAAGYLNARIRGYSAPFGGARELESSILSAARELSRGDLAREQFLPALGALVPVLTKLLPTILPAILPMLTGLLGKLVGGKSLSTDGDPLMASYGLEGDGRLSTEMAVGAIVNTIMQLLPQLAPVLIQTLAQLLPQIIPIIIQAVNAASGSGGPPQTAPLAPAPPAPSSAPAASPTKQTSAMSVYALASREMAAAIDSSTLQSLIGAIGGSGGAAGGGIGQLAGLLKNVDPKMISGLIQGIAGNAGGINQLLGGPGHELVKSVVDRLPIQEMFNGRAWIPQIDDSQLLANLTPERNFSLSESVGTVGQLFVPGRDQIRKDPDIKVTLADRVTTKLGDQDSWIFVADKPARLHVALAAGKTGLKKPFLDIRVSGDGSARAGLKRAVFRLTPLGIAERARTSIEIPIDILAQAERFGGQLCVSVRVIDRREKDAYYGNEMRACFHVVRRNTVLLDGSAPMRPEAILEGLIGLRRRLPRSALISDVTRLDWTIQIGDGSVEGLAQYHLVQRVAAPSGAYLRGGMTLSPSGLAELARRLDDSAIDVDDLGSLKAALAADSAIRSRLTLETRESFPQQSSQGSIVVASRFGSVPAHLVSFTDISQDGNPIGRQVRALRLPVPLGVEFDA